MYILTAQQVRQWDQFTIEHEPVASIDLMEKAASACISWIEKQHWEDRAFRVFCGKGNNGGDGLAIARLLAEKKYIVSVCILETGKQGSPDFEKNSERLKEQPAVFVQYIREKEHLPMINTGDILVDALFGTGLKGPLENMGASLVDHINHSKAIVVSIDMPSGLLADETSRNHTVIEADHTLTFQCYKTALLMQENAPFTGQIEVLDIGLHPAFITGEIFSRIYLTKDLIKQFYKPRMPFAHKGHFGHALLVAGSYGKMGAAILSAGGCIHAGIGLLTCYIPSCGYAIMQTSVPEAMVITDDNEKTLAQLPDEMEKYDVIGLGPGIGLSAETQHLVAFILRRGNKPLVLDADALNAIAMQPELLAHIPPLSILTPHPKEFDRLFGDHPDDFERMKTAENKARQYGIIIVLKSHHTLIATPDKSYFNSTGNAGMAKGGSGDVLTGIIMALVKQYGPEHAAMMGVFLHGTSGDFAAVDLQQESMTASDLITYLSHAFLHLSQG